MKSISAILRIVFGLVVVGFAFFTYHRIIPHVGAGEAVQLFGQLSVGLHRWDAVTDIAACPLSVNGLKRFSAKANQLQPTLLSAYDQT